MSCPKRIHEALGPCIACLWELDKDYIPKDGICHKHLLMGCSMCKVFDMTSKP